MTSSTCSQISIQPRPFSWASYPDGYLLAISTYLFQGILKWTHLLFNHVPLPEFPLWVVSTTLDSLMQKLVYHHWLLGGERMYVHVWLAAWCDGMWALHLVSSGWFECWHELLANATVVYSVSLAGPSVPSRFLTLLALMGGDGLAGCTCRSHVASSCRGAITFRTTSANNPESLPLVQHIPFHIRSTRSTDRKNQFIFTHV